MLVYLIQFIYDSSVVVFFSRNGKCLAGPVALLGDVVPCVPGSVSVSRGPPTAGS